jgi:hypothetical protein
VAADRRLDADDLDGAQHLQAHQRQQGLAAQVLGQRLPELVDAQGTARSSNTSSPSLR